MFLKIKRFIYKYNLINYTMDKKSNTIKYKADFNNRTIIKVGNSLAITLPEKELKKKGFGLGAEVDVTLEMELEDMQENYEYYENERENVDMFLEILEKVDDIGIVNRIAITNGLTPIKFNEIDNKKKESRYKQDIIKEFEKMRKTFEDQMDYYDIDSYEPPEMQEFDAESNPGLLKD